MHLSDFDLQQLDKARLSKLTVSQKEALLEKALEDRKEARERRQADSRPSSRPPSSDGPWLGRSEEAETEGEPRSVKSEAERGDSTEPEKAPEDEAKSSSKPGGRPGSPGHSRTQQLEVTETIEHRPCIACCVVRRWRGASSGPVPDLCTGYRAAFGAGADGERAAP